LNHPQTIAEGYLMSLIKIRFMAALLCTWSMGVSGETTSAGSEKRPPLPAAPEPLTTEPSLELLEFLGAWQADDDHWLQQMRQLDESSVSSPVTPAPEPPAGDTP
jgi:hypothetical protein